MNDLPEAVQSEEISNKIRIIGQAWAESSFRPRILPKLKRHWDNLIDEWGESDLPLVVRKSSGVRGEEIIHPEGRQIIIADNSPAQWAFLKAFQRSLYTLSDIRHLIETDNIPFAFAAKASDRARMKFKRTLTTRESLGKWKWKLCHIKEVGLNSRRPIDEIPLDSIKDKFRLLLKPSNQFLIPIDWSGLGELPEVIEEVRLLEDGSRADPSN